MDFRSSNFLLFFLSSSKKIKKGEEILFIKYKSVARTVSLEVHRYCFRYFEKTSNTILMLKVDNMTFEDSETKNYRAQNY